MADFPALPLWTDAYLADLQNTLTLEEHGAYMLLLMLAWRRPDCRLPDDDKWLARWLGVHGNKFRKIKKAVLAPYWMQETDGGVTYWYQKRLRKERDFQEKRTRNAREKAEKRWSLSNENKGVSENPAYASTPTPTPIEQKERTIPGPVSKTSPNFSKTIPTHTLAPPEKSGAADTVVSLKEAKPEKQYAFQGVMFRITVKDFQKWRRSFWAIPDLMAMLEHIDLWYQNAEEKKLPKNMFMAVSGWLNNEHQKRRKQGAQPPRWLLKEMGKC